MRKALCTMACGPQRELLELAREPLEDYAARHGYDLVVEQEPVAPERPLSWSKIPLLRRALADHDVAVWVDADAIFVDTSADLADELEPDRFLYFVQHRFGDLDAGNCGVLMLRSSWEAEEFLDRVWSMTQFLDHPWWEQGAVLTLLGYEVPLDACHARIRRPSAWFTRTKLLTNEWNSIRLDPAPRPRIKHYAGETHEARVRGMTADLDEFRRRRALPLRDSRFAASIVLPLAALGSRSWDAVSSLAALPETPEHEVIAVDDGSGRFDDLLAALAGDVTRVVAPGALAEAAEAAAAVAGGETVVLVEAPPAPDPLWLAGQLDALGRAYVAARTVPAADGGVVATSLAIRRDDLLARGGVGAGPRGFELTRMLADVHAAGRPVRLLAAA